MLKKENRNNKGILNGLPRLRNLDNIRGDKGIASFELLDTPLFDDSCVEYY
jgi:hypothetical protein